MIVGDIEGLAEVMVGLEEVIVGTVDGDVVVMVGVLLVGLKDWVVGVLLVGLEERVGACDVKGDFDGEVVGATVARVGLREAVGDEDGEVVIGVVVGEVVGALVGDAPRSISKLICMFAVVPLARVALALWVTDSPILMSDPVVVVKDEAWKANDRAESAVRHVVWCWCERLTLVRVLRAQWLLL
jgi:hypothetical protein